MSVSLAVYHILREASASLLVQLRWAIPEPPYVGRATVQTSRFHFLTIQRRREGPEAHLIKMKREIKLAFNATLLATDEEALKNCLSLLKELDDKGFLKNGKIVFEDENEEDVKEIFDRHVPNSEATIK